MRRTALPILLFSLAVPLTLHAAPQLQPQGVVVTLSGEATKTVANDEALITFTVERRAATPEAVTEEVVTAGNKGLEALAKWDKNTVVVETSDFSTWPVYTRAREGEASMIGGWSARQTIRVTVRDVSKVSDVMKGAAETMQYDGITFRVSEASKKAAETELLDAALNDAKRRAGVIAKNFELTDDACQVISLTIGDAPNAPIRYYAAPRVANDAVMMKSAVPAPAVSAGESTLTMRVGMEVRILPQK